jgi:hypothetical protein
MMSTAVRSRAQRRFVPMLTALTLVACTPPDFGADEQMAQCRRRVEDAKTDEIFYSLKVAECMEGNGWVQIDSGRGLLNTTNWKKR